ncbi:hypothetical protein B0H10DRAFT_1946846 [Mycena sp. CBHHK59/15]|nr:hypothetical protein B0H10DRAFT_1946846 [Mycena sp. CBHHK59/15]
MCRPWQQAYSRNATCQAIPSRHFLLTTTIPTQTAPATRQARQNGFFWIEAPPPTRTSLTASQIYTPAYIKSNPARFHGNEWIDIPTLREFLGRNVPDASIVASSTHPSTLSDLVRVKIEPLQHPAPPASAIPVKAEPQPIILPRGSAKTRTEPRLLFDGIHGAAGFRNVP